MWLPLASSCCMLKCGILRPSAMRSASLSAAAWVCRYDFLSNAMEEIVERPRHSSLGLGSWPQAQVPTPRSSRAAKGSQGIIHCRSGFQDLGRINWIRRIICQGVQHGGIDSEQPGGTLIQLNLFIAEANSFRKHGQQLRGDLCDPRVAESAVDVPPQVLRQLEPDQQQNNIFGLSQVRIHYSTHAAHFQRQGTVTLPLDQPSAGPAYARDGLR